MIIYFLVVYYGKRDVLFVGNFLVEDIIVEGKKLIFFFCVEEEVEVIGKILKIKLFIREFVIKEEVLFCFNVVVLVYIVVYGCMEIGEIYLILNFDRLFKELEKEDYFLIMVDVVSV